MTDNIIVTSDVAPAKKTSKKQSVKKVQEDARAEFSVHSSSEKKLIYYSSGSGYVTKTGLRFSPQNRIYEIDSEEADVLLKLDNFRLPDQLELEEYYKEN